MQRVVVDAVRADHEPGNPLTALSPVDSDGGNVVHPVHGPDLHYASALGAQRVLVLSPITGGRQYAKMIAKHLPPGAEVPWRDLLPIYRDGTGVRTHIMYGEQNAGDRQQSLRMAGLPGVTVEGLPDWESHHLIAGRRGRQVTPPSS